MEPLVSTSSISKTDLPLICAAREGLIAIAPLNARIRAALEPPTHAAQLAAALALPEVAAMQTALKEFLRLQKSITIDVKSAHSGRGAGVTGWMKEDDRDFSRDLDSAFSAASRLAA